MRPFTPSLVMAAALIGVTSYLVAAQRAAPDWLFALVCVVLALMTWIADGWREVARRRQARLESAETAGRWQGWYDDAAPTRTVILVRPDDPDQQ